MVVVKQCTHCQHFRQHFEQHVDLGDVGENVVSVFRAETFGNMLYKCCPTCCEINRNQFCCRDANYVAEMLMMLPSFVQSEMGHKSHDLPEVM
jgi:hypothetical protein